MYLLSGIKEVPMIGKEDYAVIKSLEQRGVYLKDIAAELGVDPRTVSRAIKRGSAPQRERKKRSSRLNPFKARVDELLSKGVWNTMVILREIQAEGYEGGTTILKEYVQPKRALRPGKATVRFACPGGLGQGDAAGRATAERLGGSAGGASGAGDESALHRE
jgi:transposase